MSHLYGSAQGAMCSRQPTHHGYAVNVKDDHRYTLDTEPLTDSEVENLYQAHAEDFWGAVQDVGREHGFKAVYSEGRMGGWAMPSPQPSEDSTGPRIEYVPEMEAWMRDRFRPFEADVLALLEDIREQFLAELADAVKRAKAEPAERAYWEARDTITQD